MAASIGRPLSSTSFNTFKFNSSTPNAPSTVTHHHHHHHPPHHHHPVRAPSASSPIPPTLARPATIIKTDALLQSVAHLPRRHLGSQLYAPRLSLPSTSATTLESEQSYECSPNPLPPFDGAENCTFTIRIPRYHLTAAARRATCDSRNIWGTDVYTDDSDPLAAAVHAGWVRGAWHSDVDEAMLGLKPSMQATTTKADVGTLRAPRAAGPVDIPLDLDCHLTLLILPPLAQYASSVRFGISSRRWGENHDGMSFRIEKLEWVDEGASSRNEERSAQARKARMALLNTGARLGSKRATGAAGKAGRRYARIAKSLPRVGEVMG